MRKFISKIAHSGFYIILFLCISAIGISGYVMYLARDTAETVKDTIDLEGSFELPFPDEAETLYDFGTEIEISGPAVTPEPEKEEEALPPAAKETPDFEKEKKEPATPTVSVPDTEEVVYTMAVNGAITEPFSGEELVKSETLGDWRIHAGVDIKGASGGDVKAIADGKVKSVESDSMMGNTVRIEHSGGIVSIYANLADGITLKAGDTVKSGDVIGKIGQSALAECLDEPHLHLEVLKNGENIDPLSLYPAGDE